MAWLSANWQVVLGILLWIWNEVLAANDSLKSNSILQLIVNVLKSLGPKQIPPSA